MAKEGTIGLAVILVLLITFVVVLARRLSGPADEAVAVAIQRAGRDSPATVGDSTDEGAQPGPPAGGRSVQKPLVVEPEPPWTLEPLPAQIGPPAVPPDPQPAADDAYVAEVGLPLQMPDPPGADGAYDPLLSHVEQTSAVGSAQIRPTVTTIGSFGSIDQTDPRQQMSSDGYPNRLQQAQSLPYPSSEPRLRWVDVNEQDCTPVGDDPAELTPGMRIRLPGDEPTGSVSQRPEPRYPPYEEAAPPHLR